MCTYMFICYCYKRLNDQLIILMKAQVSFDFLFCIEYIVWIKLKNKDTISYKYIEDYFVILISK
jgi:hypothetical protein